MQYKIDLKLKPHSVRQSSRGHSSSFFSSPIFHVLRIQDIYADMLKAGMHIRTGEFSTFSWTHRGIKSRSCGKSWVTSLQLVSFSSWCLAQKVTWAVSRVERGSLSLLQMFGSIDQNVLAQLSMGWMRWLHPVATHFRIFNKRRWTLPHFCINAEWDISFSCHNFSFLSKCCWEVKMCCHVGTMDSSKYTFQ